ncbi:MAG: ATP-binding protein, partial [Phycisphaerales bacterium]
GQADLWRKGLAEWGQSPERIARFKQSADAVVYTPGSSAGMQLSILKSFDAPPFEIVDDPELLRDRIATTTSSLLGLAGVQSDATRGREHILVATILQTAWMAGQNLDLAGIIQQVQSPAFQRVGVLELEAFFPSKDRFELAMALNNLLASPQFAAWSQGQPLDIGNMLYTATGKPRLAIVSIAHLGDAERMFFVSLLLNQLLGWTRQQSGTTSLRAILYMDEIAGYVPPVANPPSKQALLTLMKQARAFGVGCVLATQNPVDIDYKGLSNAGTWFIGRLQTEQDKARLLDGLQGAMAASNKAFDRSAMDRTISGLPKRVFVMNNVHDDGPSIFETRWCLSYLRGPLTRGQIKQLMDPIKAGGGNAVSAAAGSGAARGAPAAPAASTASAAPMAVAASGVASAPVA